MSKTTFHAELEALINRHSMENESNTPDFILAKFMSSSLDAFTQATRDRDDWFGGKRSILESERSEKWADDLRKSPEETQAPDPEIDPELLCPSCCQGEMKHKATHPNGQQYFECTTCHHEQSFP